MGMGGSGWEWVGVDGSGWEWVGALFSNVKCKQRNKNVKVLMDFEN